ncbi:MAG: hypothetical protein J6039_00500 [Alphaproteobacteria bacterium]|nr:hypothetical protein [Alphaproteobacteria bacterium]
MEKKVGSLDLGGINVKIVRDEATNQLTNCIVVPEFRNGVPLSGVAGECAQRGLKKGMETFNERARKKPFQFGDVLLTDGGCNNILLGHAVTIGAPYSEQFETVFKAMFLILKECNQKPAFRCAKIAVPELGADVTGGGLTEEQSAYAIISAVDAFSRFCGATFVKEVILCVKGSIKPAEKILKGYYSFRELCTSEGQKPFDYRTWISKATGLNFCPQ